MIIRVQKHTDRYTVIDNTGPNDSRLGLKARGLLSYLLTKPDNWEITVSGIVASVPDGKDAVQSALKELERFGYAEYRTVRGEKGRVLGKKWVIFENPDVKAADSQRLMSDLSDHRQPGFPIIGKTDNRKNRLSENPQQVSTVTVVSNDYSVNTVLRTSRGKKIDVKSSVEQCPPSSGAPPRGGLLFFELDFSQQSFFEMLSDQLPGFTRDQSDYYFDRCRKWSADKQARSKDWVGVALKFIEQDKQRLIKKQNSNGTNGNPNQGQSNRGIDPVRSIDRARRFIDRNRIPNGSTK